jgi:pSer/pThr/pTyr-binding forkhead associated (FHA) protein
MQVRLKVIKGKQLGQFIQFPKGEFMFGRGPECEIRPNSDLISRQHCLLHVSDTSAIIRDLGSRNGTLVNGQIVHRERILEDGDTLQLGPLVLEVLLDASLVDTALAFQKDATMNGSATPNPV